MKKLLITIILFITVSVIAAMYEHSEKRPFQKVFKDGMLFAKYDTYIDPDFNYCFEYPSFFQKDDIDYYGVGHVQYGYHANDTNIVMECKVVPDSTVSCKKKDFIQKGACKSLSNYCYYSHYIRKKNAVYILSLIYPNNYEEAVSSILYRIKRWKPFRSPKKLGVRR